MFNIGDKIVYPSQGVGVIASIQEREIKGEKQYFYGINIYNSTMKLTLPISRLEASKIRLVSSCDIIDYNLNKLNKFAVSDNEIRKYTTKERMAVNSQKVKDGKLDDYLDVICNLTQVICQGSLNANEKQLLNTTKEFVIEEICQSKLISKEEATELLDRAIISLAN